MLEASFTFFHVKCKKKYEALLIFDIWIKRAQVKRAQFINIQKWGVHAQKCFIQWHMNKEVWRLLTFSFPRWGYIQCFFKLLVATCRWIVQSI